MQDGSIGLDGARRKRLNKEPLAFTDLLEAHQRGPNSMLSRTITDSPGVPDVPQEDAEQRAAPWHQLWLDGSSSEDLQWPRFEKKDLDELVMPDYDQFIVLARSFSPSRRGVGCCFFHPRHFAFLSKGGYEALVAIWRAMFWLGTPPHLLKMLIFVLIPKPAGGDRPIGLLPSLVRVLNRWLRRQYGEIWRKSNERTYFFGTKHRSTLALSWRMSAAAEYAKVTKCESAAALLDLVKAFGHVRHDALRWLAEKYGFSSLLLRFLISLYKMPRMIRVGKVYTQSVSATRSIVPGDAFADLLMRLAMMSSLDITTCRWDNIVIGVVADDVQFLAVGGTRIVERDLPDATSF